MSYSSNFNLNQRVSYLESLINSLIPPFPTSSTLAQVLVNGNSAGASDIDMNNNDILLVNNITASTLSITSDSVGYTSNPTLIINNTNPTAGNTTGVPSIELTKTGRNGAVNDIVGSVFFNAKDSAGVERTFGKIESTITNTIAPSNHDGALDFYSLINGVNQLVFRMNGADNENNSFRPLDLNGNTLKTSVNDLIIDATQSVNGGIIILKPKTTGHIIIPASSSPFLDFIKIQPNRSLVQSIDMNATDYDTGDSNSINLTNDMTTPSIQVIANTSGVVGNPFLNITTTDSVSNIQQTTNASTISIVTEVVDLTTFNTKQIGISTPNGLKLINNLDTDPLVIQSTNTTNSGSIEFIPDSIGGDLIFTGANIESASAGVNSGSRLRIKLNGVYYKIQLFAD